MPLIRKPGTPPEPAADRAAAAGKLVGGTDEERWAAARAVSQAPDGARLLCEALAGEKNPRVRAAMLTGLARIGTPQSVEALLPFLRSDDAHLRTEASDALAAMKSAVFPYLASLLRDGDGDVRILACELVRNMPGEEATRLLLHLLDAELEPNVCAAAVEVLSETGGAEALPVLARCGERFKATPFLAFSIKAAADRIRAHSSERRA